MSAVTSPLCWRKGRCEEQYHDTALIRAAEEHGGDSVEQLRALKEDFRSRRLCWLCHREIAFQ